MGHHKRVSVADRLCDMNRRKYKKWKPEKFHSWCVAQCRAVSSAHISASYLSYLHRSAVVTAGLLPKQDRLPSPASVSTLLSSQLYLQGPTGLPPATLSGNFSSLCPSANNAPLAILSLCMPASAGRGLNDVSPSCNTMRKVKLWGDDSFYSQFSLTFLVPCNGLCLYVQLLAVQCCTNHKESRGVSPANPKL